MQLETMPVCERMGCEMMMVMVVCVARPYCRAPRLTSSSKGRLQESDQSMDTGSLKSRSRPTLAGLLQGFRVMATSPEKKLPMENPHLMMLQSTDGVQKEGMKL